MPGILTSTLNLILEQFLSGSLTLEMIGKYKSTQKILLDGYNTGVAFKKISPIEDLPQEAKWEYFTQGKELRPDYGREEITRLCKGLYYLTILATKYDK